MSFLFFSSFFSSSLAVLLRFLIATLASSPNFLTCFTYSLLLSSVNAGILRIIISPLFDGAIPILDSLIAFSIFFNFLSELLKNTNVLTQAIENSRICDIIIELIK